MSSRLNILLFSIFLCSFPFNIYSSVDVAVLFEYGYKLPFYVVIPLNNSIPANCTISPVGSNYWCGYHDEYLCLLCEHNFKYSFPELEAIYFHPNSNYLDYAADDDEIYVAYFYFEKPKQQITFGFESLFSIPQEKKALLYSEGLSFEIEFT